MKKIIIIAISILVFSIAVVSIFFVYESNKYNGWKTLYIETYGTVKVPDSWILESKDGLFYLTDKPLDEDSCNIFFIQTKSYATVFENYESVVESNRKANQFQHKKMISGGVLSNSVTYGKSLYLVNGVEREMLNINLLFGQKEIEFVAWDESIDESFLKKMGESFLSEQYTEPNG